MSRRGGVALLLIVGLLLAGCVPEPDETDRGRSSAEASASVSPTPPEAAIAVPDDCGDVLSDTELSELTGQEQYLAPTPPSLEALPGPLARETAQGADERRDCMWWIVDVWEGSLPLFVSRTSAEAQTALTDGLRTSTLYTETTIRGELAFTSTYTDEIAIHEVVYVFVDDVWIAVVAAVEPARAVAIAERALTALTG